MSTATPPSPSPDLLPTSTEETEPTDDSPVLAAGSLAIKPLSGTRKIPFFYGWAMLPIAMLAHIATSPGQTFGVSVFNPWFRSDLGLSETQLTGAYGLGTLLACLPLPLVGVWMDRWGIRRSMVVVTILLGCACLFASQVQGLVTLFLAFLFLRMLGQGALSMLSGNTLAMWFHTRLGTVTGLMSVCVILIMGQLPPLFRMLIDGVGWRWAYAILGGIVWVTMLPVLAFFFCNRPEDIGQHTDGLTPTDDDNNQADDFADAHQEFELGEALRTRAYWIVMGIYATWAMVGTALVFNISNLFVSGGLEAGDAIFTLMVFFNCIAGMQLVGGFLADRAPLHYLMSLGAAGMTFGLAMLVYLGGPWYLAAYSIFGLSQGMLGAAGNTVWVRYYGRRNIGKIRSGIFMATVAGSSLGPVMMGVSFDFLGGYEPSLCLFLALFAPLSVAALLATKPQKAAQPA